jgi:hypothetical protein
VTQTPTAPEQRITGEAYWVLEGPDGEIKGFGHSPNAITDYGDRMYAERGANIAGAPAAPVTMALGTNNATAPAKSGAGSTLVTPLTGAAVALGTPTARAGTNARQIEYVGVFPAGVGTTSGTPIREAVITNVAAGTAPATTNTISRLLLTPEVGTKGAADTLTVTWLHNLGSAAT